MVRIELSRARSRRLVLFLALGCVGAVVAITLGAFATHHDQTPQSFRAPRLAPPVGSPPGGLVTVVSDKRFHYTDLRESDPGPDGGSSGGIVPATSGVFFAIAVVVGASLVGAEYRFGTIATLLTWEPRRVRVLVAKVVAAMAVVAAAYLVLEGLLALALVPVAVTRGTFAGADAAFARGLAGEILRGAALAAGLAGLGACLATVGRNTSAALGGLVVYLVGVEAVLRAQKPSWIPWFLVENVAVVLTGKRHTSAHIHRSTVASALLLVAYLAAAVALTTGLFVRRDVT